MGEALSKCYTQVIELENGHIVIAHISGKKCVCITSSTVSGKLEIGHTVVKANYL
jgi:hypothetical protein